METSYTKVLRDRKTWREINPLFLVLRSSCDWVDLLVLSSVGLRKVLQRCDLGHVTRFWFSVAKGSSVP